MSDNGDKLQINKKLPHWGLIQEIEDSRTAKLEAAMASVLELVEENARPNHAELAKYSYVRGIKVGARNGFKAFVDAGQKRLVSATPTQRNESTRLLLPFADGMFTQYADSMLKTLEMVQQSDGGFGNPTPTITAAAQKAESEIRALLPEKTPTR